jgi:hypothetical protein
MTCTRSFWPGADGIAGISVMVEIVIQKVDPRVGPVRQLIEELDATRTCSTRPRAITSLT